VIQEIWFLHGWVWVWQNYFWSLCIWKKFLDGEFIILLLYVDDILIIGYDTSKIDRLKDELSKSFAVKDLGPAK